MRILVMGLAIALCGFVPPRLERRIHTLVRISDAGQLYSTINTIDCLAWPNDDIKTAAGLAGWSGWYPKNGDVGVPISRSIHCFQKDVTVVVVRFGEHIAPLGSRGLTFERGSVEEVPLFTKPNPAP